MSEEAWIVQWFVSRGAIARDARPDAHYGDHIFEAGLLDSFGVIELVAEVEDHFGVEFNERHFQDRRFAFIAGLAEIIRSMPVCEGAG